MAFTREELAAYEKQPAKVVWDGPTHSAGLPPRRPRPPLQ